MKRTFFAVFISNTGIIDDDKEDADTSEHLMNRYSELFDSDMKCITQNIYLLH